MLKTPINPRPDVILKYHSYALLEPVDEYISWIFKEQLMRVLRVGSFVYGSLSYLEPQSSPVVALLRTRGTVDYSCESYEEFRGVQRDRYLAMQDQLKW